MFGLMVESKSITQYLTTTRFLFFSDDIWGERLQDSCLHQQTAALNNNQQKECVRHIENLYFHLLLNLAS